MELPGRHKTPGNRKIGMRMEQGLYGASQRENEELDKVE
jgi:hypothetical protein